MALSTHGESLFHFTGSLTNLESILTGGHFNVSFSLEKLTYQTQTKGREEIPDLWVPMVSFCDYKLSEISHHIISYGSYGLGMSKEWGIRNGLNPVLYVSEYSRIGNSLKTVLERVANVKAAGNDSKACHQLIGDADIQIANFYAWTKNYQGELRRGGALIGTYRFADEKEWRYVGEIDYRAAHGLSKIFLDGYSFIPLPQVICPCCGKAAQFCQNEGTRILKAKKKDYENLIKISTSKLPFDDTDINFILVKSRGDRSQILGVIMNQNERDHHQKLLLASKVTVIDDLDLRELAPIND